MMKALLLSVVVVLNCLTAQAFVELGETYTGKTSSKAADFLLDEVPNGPNYLGGEIGRSSVIKVSRQFTVNEFSTANYLAVSGILRPSPWVFDQQMAEYNHSLRDQGLTTDEIIARMGVFNGYAQEMDVDFSIIKGSRPFGLDFPRYTPIPTTEVIATGNYKFLTDNSRFEKNFSNIFVPLSPFEVPLEPGQDYWVKAAPAKFSGTTLTYNTQLYGEVTTPEPATFLLLGGGLIAAFRRRKAMK